jgi:hypothetical protein
MSANPPKGWTRDSEKLFIHNTGVRIQLMTYRQKEGWFLVPTDLDQAVVEFTPTPEGRDQAFEAFASGVLNVKTKAKAASPTKKRKPRAVVKKEKEEPAEEGDSGEMDDDSD